MVAAFCASMLILVVMAFKSACRGVETLVVDVQHGLIPVIPVGEAQEQPNGSDNRRRWEAQSERKS